MGLFGFGKKKEKTLEEMARAKGITILTNGQTLSGYMPLDGPDGMVKGAGQTREEANEHLINNLVEKGFSYIGCVDYSQKVVMRERLEKVEATVYTPVQKPAA